MPAYNAGKTLRATCAEVPMDVVDEIILVDDASRDETVAVAQALGLRTVVHAKNRGYGGNQKSCYKVALAAGADFVIMLHPDYQYTPKLVSAMAYILESGLYDVVLGSRILGGQALQGGMPKYKYLSNRFLTMAQNLLMGAKLSEYHTGYRAFTRRVLETVPIEGNSDDFVFDNQMLSQIPLPGLQDRRGDLPGQVLPRGLVDQLCAQHAVRARLLVDCVAVPAGQDGLLALALVRGLRSYLRLQRLRGLRPTPWMLLSHTEGCMVSARRS